MSNRRGVLLGVVLIGPLVGLLSMGLCRGWFTGASGIEAGDAPADECIEKPAVFRSSGTFAVVAPRDRHVLCAVGGPRCPWMMDLAPGMSFRLWDMAAPVWCLALEPGEEPPSERKPRPALWRANP